MATETLSASSAGAVASVVYAAVGYQLGWMDARTAEETAIAGTAGSATAALSWAAAESLIVTYGTASTGTAIASLGGAAASSSTLAWLGGGSLAAGGGGVAAGGVILTGGLALVAFGGIAAVTWGFHCHDMLRSASASI